MTEQEWLTSNDPRAMLAFLTQSSFGPAGLAREEEEIRQRRAITPSDRKLRLFAVACFRADMAEKRDDYNSYNVELFRHAEKMADNPRSVGKSDNVTSIVHLAVASDAAQHAVYQLGELNGPILPKLAALLREIVGNPFRPVVLPKGQKCKRCDYLSPGQYTPDDGWGVSEKCKPCNGSGFMPCPWITPQTLSLAHAAYDERGRKCPNPRCSYRPYTGCSWCHGAGTIDEGTLDNFRLALLADALEEAGCAEEAPGKWRRCGRCGELFAAANKYSGCDGPGCDEGDKSEPATKWQTHPIVAHLRSPGPHVRGCWALDLILGQE